MPTIRNGKVAVVAMEDTSNAEFELPVLVEPVRADVPKDAFAKHRQSSGTVCNSRVSSYFKQLVWIISNKSFYRKVSIHADIVGTGPVVFKYYLFSS